MHEQEFGWHPLAGRAATEPAPFFAALLAGQLGGVAFLGFWILMHLLFFQEFPWFWPVQVIASFFLGSSALFAPFWLTFVLGILINQAVAFGWSFAFAWVVDSSIYHPRLATNLTAGLILGLVAAFVDIYLLVPPIFGVLHDWNPWWVYLDRVFDWLAHIAFGLTTGWFFQVFRP
jgi:hypothetical protein